MEKISLEASIRKEGKGAARRARLQGAIPGIVYGKTYKPVYVTVNEKALEKAVATHAGLNVLLDLAVADKEKVVARICDYQADPIERTFTHVDFQVVDLKQKITVDVPVQFTGKSKGVKEGGVLVIDRRELKVKCLPIAIPEHIDVDITELMVGDSVHINDLKLPEGVECSHEINFSIVSVVAPMKEEVAAPVAEAVTAEGAAAATAAPGAAPAGAAPAGGAASTPAAAKGAAAAPAAAAKGAPAKEKK
ncbi:MAG: 50S ribosomal protein L25/general stress protein Ctc [Deltaproteobacteria bacterium]|nr:50S ribosomal protein L25/general stress protein Ctc [Deltaproteobacteria bacterium]MBI2341351.1 50S ribosomal protein L25/general stress protein Ctc [Deltaproteobacteria bacterium]MBI2975303.1 50S ribosomal protein L25/general stress protein Ctc [Deltaproteobacteria bacterium]